MRERRGRAFRSSVASHSLGCGLTRSPFSHRKGIGAFRPSQTAAYASAEGPQGRTVSERELNARAKGVCREGWGAHGARR